MEKMRTFYFKDMILYILRKWRVILIWMIICSLFLNGYAVWKNYMDIKVSNQIQNQNEEDMTQYTTELSDEAIKKVDETYQLYLSCKESLDRSVGYYNNSIKTNIDPNNVPTTVIQYEIRDTEHLSDVIALFDNISFSQSSNDKIKNQLNITDDNLQYIKELVEINFNQEGNQLGASFNENEAIIQNAGSAIMTIQVIALDENMSEIISDVLEEEVRDSTQKFQSSLGDFTIQKIDRTFYKEVNYELLDIQQNYVSKISAIKTSIENLKVSLDDNQLAYYNALISQNEESNDEKNNMSGSVGEIQFVHVKYLALGIFAGLVVVIFWYFIRYIFNKYLLVSRELKEFFGVDILDTFSGKRLLQRQFIIDKLINYIFSVKLEDLTNEKIQMICTKIKIDVQRKKLNTIYITGTIDSEEAENVKQSILNYFERQDFNVIKGKSVLTDIDSLQTLANSDGVVFIEQIEKSIFSDIDEEISFSMKNNTEIVGAIIIE